MLHAQRVRLCCFSYSNKRYALSKHSMYSEGPGDSNRRLEKKTGPWSDDQGVGEFDFQSCKGILGAAEALDQRI
jgi:hypothetical protein